MNGKCRWPDSTPPCANAHAAGRFDVTSSTIRSAPVARMNTVYQITSVLSFRPLEQHVLARHAGPEGEQQPVRARPLLELVGQQVEHRRRRQVADGIEQAPARLELAAFEVETALERLQHARSTRMSEPAVD